MFWKKKESVSFNSDEFESLTKKVVAIVADIDSLGNKLEVVHQIVRSNRARINKINVDEIVDKSDKSKSDGPLYI